ncbi:extended synaptotagmin-2-A isoform X2 [Chrysoperla carnea]|uniref:extended synaptotagmin-2-A isoform X2 n=1 Tax=Chrysoperla carnea TaxID=189513 RepID=UPI001D07AE6D|nr:extended synaptotagmin-2-A isoform X2 [Chrysoperla carnea]
MSEEINKVEDPNKAVVPVKRTSSSSIMSTGWSAFKKIATVGAVYLIGYMNWSVAWLIGPVVLSVIRDQWKKEKEIKRNIAKASALSNEKDVILARIDELPAWVFFPDVDRAEWLNRIIKQLWPNVNQYARNLIKDVIEPKVNEALVAYKMYGFRFERLILGTIPPRIGGVKVYEKNTSRNEIIMDVDLFYAGDCDISFYLQGVKGGIKDFQIHGMLRVVMTPLITQVPLVGGVQLFFLNNPTIDFDLVGIADVLDMPGLGDMLRRIIVEQVAAMMVLPNKLPIVLSDSVDLISLKMPEPEGVLRIHVVEAKHLMKKDIGMLGKGKSDPYAVVNIGSQVFRTKAIDNTVNPKWDHWFESVIMDSNSQRIFIHLWDKDDGPKDDEPLGRATIEVGPVVEKGELDTWLTLEQAKHGMVHIRLTWLSLSNNTECLKKTIKETQELRITDLSTALLAIYIDSAKNLPQARGKSKPDTYAVLSVGKNTQQTDVVMREDCPVWERGFTFLVPNPETDTLTLKIMDQKTGSCVGEMEYNLSTLLSKENLEIVKQPLTLHSSGPDSKIVIAMKLHLLKYPEIKLDSGGDLADPTSKLIRSDSTVSASSVVTLPPSTPNRKFENIRKQDSIRSAPSTMTLPEESSSDNQNSTEELIIQEKTSNFEANPSDNSLRRRQTTIDDAGEEGLGRIQLTIRYSVQRQKLIVIVHKIKNLPQKDPSNIPDPYVKIYLLPERAKESKRKTNVIKDNCDPVFDESFEYTLSPGELKTKQLEITVVTQKSIFSSGNNIMGQVIIDLGKSDFTQALTDWFDLYAEYSSIRD